MSAKIIRPARATCVRYLPRDVYAVVVCLSVRPSVCQSVRHEPVLYQNGIGNHMWPIDWRLYQWFWMTLKVIRLLQAFSKWCFSYSCSVVTRSQLTAWSRGPSTIAELQLLVIRSVGVAFTLYFSILLVLTRDCYQRLTIVKLKIMMDLFSVLCGGFCCLSRL